jgi:hypothetical protein
VLDLTPAAPPMPPPSRFLREETIVEGAFATTYRARDLVAGRLVTLTQVSAEQAADAFFLTRFEREASLLATIDHPNIVRLIASGTENGVPFVATEHVAGRELADVIGERGAPSVGEATTMARQILAGLGAIHAAGLLHLRLTPRAILLGDDGIARITGVGIAGLAAGDDRSGRGAGVAVTRYLAPELIEGGDVCEATDLYAVGAILFEALTGQPPFPGSNPVLVRFAQLQAPPPVPSQHAATTIPPALDGVVVRALAKESERRFASAEAMAAALVAEDVAIGVERVVEETTTAISPPLPSGNTGAATPFVESIAPVPLGYPERPARRRQASAGWLWPMIVAGAAIALLIAGLTVSLSGEPSIDEMVAGVSTFEEAPTRMPTMVPTSTTGAAAVAPATATPTARVIRQSNTAAEPEPEPTKKPRRRRTPTPADDE